jgi:hypothetical protein
MMYDVSVPDLKVGDKIGVSGGGWEPMPEIRTVAKRTATQVVLDDGTRWNKYGRKVGHGSSGYYRQRLMTLAEAEEQRAEALKNRARKKLMRDVRDLDLDKISDEGLQKILDIAAIPAGDAGGT